MKKRAKQLTALLLSAAMTFGMVTTSASATGASSSDETSSATTESTSSSSTSSTVLASFDEETLAVTAQAITDEAASAESSATEEEQAIKDEIYNDIFWNSDSVVDVSDYSTDVETMNELTDEVLEENNASTLVTVTYEEDELTGKATVMSVDMDPELEAVTEEVQAMADDEENPYAITEDQAGDILDLYAEYKTACDDYVAYIGRQTAWYTSYEQSDDELGPLGSLLVLAGLSVDYLRNYANYETDSGKTVYDTVVTIIQMYTYAYEYGVEYYGNSIISAKNDALEAVQDAGCKTEAQEYMVLTDWMSNRISFDMAYIMNQSAEVMACADPETPDHYNDMYSALKDIYYKQYSAYGMDEATAQGYAEQTAAGLTDGIYTVWESCTIGGLGEGLGSCVCLGYSMTFAYLVQWLHPEIYAANGTELTTSSSSWKSVEELNYKTTTTTETVTTTKTTWDGTTYYAVSTPTTVTVADPVLTYSETDKKVTFSCETSDVTFYYSYTAEDADDYIALDSGDNTLDVSTHIPGTLYAYAELEDGTKSNVVSVSLTESTEETTPTDPETEEGGNTSSEEETPVETEDAEAGEPLVKTGTTVTEYPLYVETETAGEYEQAKDDDGNLLYVQDYDDSLTTKENTGYPVYITKEVTDDKEVETDVFSIDAGYIVDIVEIYYNASVSMFGEVNEDFQSQHFWSAVKLDGEWYYIDTNYIDIYTECMIRDRVETNGDLNFNYFLFSDDTANELYGDYMDSLITLYGGDGVAENTQYEGGAWMYYSGSNIYVNGGNAYYVFDSTDLMSMASMMSSGDFDMSSYTGDMSDYEDEEVEYKIVYHTLTTKDVTDSDTAVTDYTTLIDFNNGQIYNPSTKSMEDNDLLKELFALHQEYEEIYPSLSLTMALYDGVIYFNVANCVLSYNLSTGDLVRVKEYNEVYADRDESVLFGGMGFNVVYSEDEADVVVENPPIAGLVIYDDTLYVDVASCYGWISGKSSADDTSSYGWEYAQSNYNSGYNSMMKTYLDDMTESEKQQYAEYLGEMDTDNDNDEFMFSANFTDTLSMSTVTSNSLTYSEVSVEASCNNNAFTENRSTEGLIKDGTRSEVEGTACDHHYVKYDETYYNTDENGNQITGTSYVCTICGKAYDNDDAEDDDEEVVAEYEAAKASAGHDYVTDTSVDGYVTWAEDYSYALINNLTCSVCGDRKQTVLKVDSDGNNKETTIYNLDVLNDEIDELEISLSENEAIQCTEIVSEVTGGTCDTGLDVTYTAYGPADTEYGDFSTVVMDTTSTTLPAGTHSYVADDDSWVWTENPDGTYTVTVTEMTCSECGDVQTNVEAVVTSETDLATCTEDGKTVYTAKATVYDADGNEKGSVTDYKTVVLEATGHDYDENGICRNGCGMSEISYGTMTLSEDTVLYTEEAQTPTVTLTMTSEEGTDVVLTEGTDYEVSYEDNVEIGTATVTVTGKGSYEGTQSKTFTISELATPELTAISNTTSGVKITWSESENAKQYAVFRRKSGSTSWPETQLALTDETSYTDTTASSGTTYEYTVRCIDSTGTNYTSEYDTNGVSIVYLTAGKVTSLANAKSGMTIKWDEVKGASGYLIYRKVAGSPSYGSYFKKISDGSTTSYTEGSKMVGESGTKYTYKVIPYYKDSDGNTTKGSCSATKSKVRLSAGKITSLSKSSSGITIKWEKVEGATGYIVYRKTNKSGSTEYKKIKTITSGSTVSYKDTANKTNGTKYTYKVVPYYQESSSSSKVNGSFTSKSTYWVKAVSISSLKSNSSKKMTVKWGKNSSATGYQIQYSTSSDFSNAKTVWVKSSSTTSKTISSLTKGKKYYVRVRAYKSVSGTKYYSTWSSKKSVTISK